MKHPGSDAGRSPTPPTQTSTREPDQAAHDPSAGGSRLNRTGHTETGLAETTAGLVLASVTTPEAAVELHAQASRAFAADYGRPPTPDHCRRRPRGWVEGVVGLSAEFVSRG